MPAASGPSKRHFDASGGDVPGRWAADEASSNAAEPPGSGAATRGRTDQDPAASEPAAPEPAAAPDNPSEAGLRAVIGAEYGRNLTQLAASAVDPRHIEVERALFETLFDQVPVGIAIYDTERRYVLVNQAYADYTGLSGRDYIGRLPEEANPDLGNTTPLLQRHVLDTGEPVVDMLVKAATLATEPGRWRYWSVSYARLQTEDGRVVGLTAIVMDVTERQKAAERNKLARERAALLNAANNRIGISLDVDRIAATLADVAVPGFCDAATVYLLDVDQQQSGGAAIGGRPVAAIALSALSTGESAAKPLHMHVVAARSRAGVAAAGSRPQARRSRLRGSGRGLPPIAPGTALHDCLARGRARFITIEDPHDAASPAADTAAQGGGADSLPTDGPYANSLHANSLHANSLRTMERSIVAPLKARGSLLGAVRFVRAMERDEFTLVDLDTADELAARAAIGMDNARLYMRERDTALMLQRSLLPQRFDAVEGTQVAFRYRPGPAGAQVGGDWCDVIPLPCRRVAFVIGDVMGSGLSAAGIMSQFRTAARTLAQLDLNPALVLRELDELARSMSESHLATCVYAVYDPVAGQCVMASAGHPPPVLALSSGGVELVELSPGAPLGVGGQRFEERELTIEPGCALALYTDGLVEGRDRDIETGIDELLGAISKSAPVGPPPAARGAGRDATVAAGGAVADSRRLEAACDEAFESLLGPHRGDDATLLIAALGRFPEHQVASWVLTSQPTVAARARELVRRCLHQWAAQDAAANADDRGLSPLDGDVTDVVELLVSELVTNALRYARGPIGLRLLRGKSTVVCEVSDELDAAPRLRAVRHGEEGGRGLYLVDQLSLSWGTRTTAHGKIVWFEV